MSSAWSGPEAMSCVLAGGQALIKNNVIERGPMAQQANMIHFGGEGTPYAGSSLTVTGNSFVNDRIGATVGVLN